MTILNRGPKLSVQFNFVIPIRLLILLTGFLFKTPKNEVYLMKKCLFDYDVEELIRNKDVVQFRLTELEIEYKRQEAELLLNTDFKELKLTNDKMRTAYVTNALIDLKESIELPKNSLNIVHDLIKLRMKGGD